MFSMSHMCLNLVKCSLNTLPSRLLKSYRVKTPIKW